MLTASDLGSFLAISMGEGIEFLLHAPNITWGGLPNTEDHCLVLQCGGGLERLGTPSLKLVGGIEPILEVTFGVETCC